MKGADGRELLRSTPVLPCLGIGSAAGELPLVVGLLVRAAVIYSARPAVGGRDVAQDGG